MKYLRRATALAAVAASAALILAGCTSSGGGEEATGGSSAGGGETINVWGWSGAPGAATMNKVIDAYEKANPGVTVNYNEITNTDYANKATLGLSSKQDIDVIGVFPNNWAKDNEDYLVPVDEWPGVTGLLDKFQSTAVDQEKKLFSDGTVRSVPLDSNGSAIGFYNVDLLAKAGLTSPPQTWDDMAKLAEGLKQSAPDAVAAVVPSDGWFQDDFVWTLAGQVDPEAWNDVVYNGGKYDTDALRQALGAYRQAYVDGALDSSVLDVKYTDAMSLFAQGKAAVVFSGTWDSGLLLGSYREANGISASDVGAMAVPGTDAAKLGLRAFLDTTYGIPANSQHKEAAARFIEYLTAGDGVDVWAPSLVGVPALKDWTLPDGVLTTKPEQDGYATLQKLVADPNGDRFVYGNLQAQEGTYDLQVAAGTMSPDDAAKQGQTDLESGNYS